MNIKQLRDCPVWHGSRLSLRQNRSSLHHEKGHTRREAGPQSQESRRFFTRSSGCRRKKERGDARSDRRTEFRAARCAPAPGGGRHAMLIAENYDEVLIAPPHLDAGSRLDFRRAALEHLERVAQRNETRVVIDLQHTTDIDASGLGVLVLVQKRAREQMIALTKLEYLFELED